LKENNMTTALNRQMQRAVPYALSCARTQVGAGLAVTLTVQIPGDADFECRYITALATSPLATIVIRDSGTRLEMMNQATVLGNVTGTGQQPFVLPQPALFARNSNIEIVLADLSGAPNTIQVTFCGFLLYPAPGLQR
jgi:hypothetical protein